MTGNNCSCRERERERERESYTLKKKSAVLFDSLTHTDNLVKNKKERYRSRKNSKLICKNGKIPFKQTNFAILFCA